MKSWWRSGNEVDILVDMNFAGQFWGMPFNFTGQATNFTVGLPDNIPYATTPWYIPFIAALAGATVGGLITFAITYAKARAEMRWDLKQSALAVLVDEVDQVEARLPATNKAARRKARHHIRIAFENEEIRRTAEKILGETPMPLAEMQRIFDDELMPSIERDIQDTIENWWRFWRW